MGHSAGAIHVASYVSHPEFYKVKNGGLRGGAIMVSGIYDLTAAPLTDPEKAYFGSDALPLRQRVLAARPSEDEHPVDDGEFGVRPARLCDTARSFKEASCKRPAGCVRTVMLLQHNHMSEVYSINTADTRLTDQILEFVKTGK